MNDIYATPTADVTPRVNSARAGGSIDDAVAGNIEVSMLQTLGDAWRGLKGFKLKCHIATLIWLLVYLAAILVTLPVIFALSALGADATTSSIISSVVQLVAIAATMPINGGDHHHGYPPLAGKVGVGRIDPELLPSRAATILWYVLCTLMISLGFLLLILPGIYLSFAYMFSLPLMIEKDLDAWSALETSRKAVTRIWLRAAGFLFLIMLLVSLGMIPLGIPLIWIVPWVTLAYAMLYFRLFGAEAPTLAD